MQYYFAPLEGITDSTYRALHSRYFPGVTRYYTPFLSPTVHRCLTPKEKRELPPAHTLSCLTIPQLLTKVPEDFLWMAQVCKDLGYPEVNLNVGCPSGTVTAKGKGAGMLTDLSKLNWFLSEIFEKTPLPVSVKTRIGFDSPEEFPQILEVFNGYPITELIVHPRIRKDFYSGSPNRDAFRLAVETGAAPVCYNGNLHSLSQIEEIRKEFPHISSVMLGRGLIGDPGLLSPNGTTLDTLEAFYEELLERYLVEFKSSRNAMFRLKEHWRFLQCKFEDSPKLFKALRKTTDTTQYREITHKIFRTLPLRPVQEANW